MSIFDVDMSNPQNVDWLRAQLSEVERLLKMASKPRDFIARLSFESVRDELQSKLDQATEPKKGRAG